jgi:serine/alanine adding enzyme
VTADANLPIAPPPPAHAADIVVQRLDQGSERDFDAYLAGRDDAALYHTVVWRDFIAQVFRHEPVYFIARRGGRTAGVWPSFLVRLPGLGSKLISIPYDIGSGGALGDDDDVDRALTTAAVDAGRVRGARFVEIRRSRESPVLDALGLQAARPVLLSDLAIDPGVWSRVKKDQKQAVHMAKQRGVRVRETGAPADFERFYRVYLTVFRNFGTPPYARRYFSALPERFGGSGHARLFVAEVHDRVVGGLLLFCFGRTWTNKFTLCLPEAAPLRANAALYAAAVDAAIAAGVRTFSMGSSAPHQHGLIEFKERWGAVSRPAVLYVSALRGTAPDVGRYFNESGLPQRIWRRLPIPATQLLGGPLNRWFC